VTEDNKPIERYIVRTGKLDDTDGFQFAHPFNPNSDLRMIPLSDRVGMQRAQLALGRIAPGKESFIPHAHATQEEFIFILAGAGEIEINSVRAALGPGDYVGFPTDGAVHQLYNTGTVELVYLMGGERTSVEYSRFPTISKIGVWAEGAMRYFDEAAAKKFRLEDFVKK
jgi:uncharacterized cupin superfamily protein